MDKLRLPKNVTQDTIDVIGRVYRKIGSIRKCETKEDFGRYRFILVKEFDKQFKDQEKTITRIEEKLSRLTKEVRK